MVVARARDAAAAGAERDFAAAVGATTLGAERMVLDAGEVRRWPATEHPYEGYAMVLDREGDVNIGGEEGGLHLVMPGCARIAAGGPTELRPTRPTTLLLLWCPLPAAPEEGMTSLRLSDVRRRRGVRDIGRALGAGETSLVLVELGQAGRHDLREPAATEELLLVSRGSGSVVVEGAETPIEAGDVLLRREGDPPARLQAARRDELGLLGLAPWPRR